MAFAESTDSFCYEVKPDRLIDQTYQTIAPNGRTIESGRVQKKWELSQDISAYPQFKAENMPLLEAVYYLTLEETKKNTHPLHGSPTPVFNTGVHWNKVWTRDTSFAVQYSLGWIDPETSKASLLEKIKGDPLELQEDTGTGGSYPVSTDRIIIAMAVWEHYLATGDTAYLAKMYPVLKYTAEKDLHICYDPRTGLFKGETSGLDHRRKTYPIWMDNGYFSDIAQSKATSTNIFYAVLFKVLAESSDILNKGESAKWNAEYLKLKDAINTNLWIPEKNAYTSWQYPEYMGNPVTDKIDVIANGYAVYYGIADAERSQKILAHYPMIKYGANTVYPQKPDGMFVYHNWGVWPGWEGALMLGAKKAGNHRIAEEILKSNLYNVAMNLSNYEVVHYQTGQGLCSTQQLWSIASTLASYYRILFGMTYETDGLRLSPYVPSFVKGPLILDRYPYKGSLLSLTVTGTGSRIKTMSIDGRIIDRPEQYVFRSDGKNHDIRMELDGSADQSPINIKQDNLVVCPDIPQMIYADGKIQWKPETKYGYLLWTGTEYIDVTGKSEYKVPQNKYGCYTLIAVTEDGIHSEFSAPVVFNPAGTVWEYEMEDVKTSISELPKASEIKGYSGDGYLVDKVDGQIKSRKSAEVWVTVPESGEYLISFRYNNGDRGDVGTTGEAHCAIRSLLIDGQDIGTIVFSTTFRNQFYPSTTLRVPLAAGRHLITLAYNTGGKEMNNSYDINMDTNKNDVYLDTLKLEWVGKNKPQ
ncbi:hypothetical protein ICN84_04715 [Akkermansia glycaniphila]|uniref:alpha-L-rhamnosidase-related protein n=1 Tax=Akkermansia glycaniphila TaxID=1679444 RepID=UPI001C01F143|nr:hypothetical protein [Akkermansia glycaniphila]MBT9449376.1 hypothetical protein [Akkermansia glycaniphila]